MNKKTLVLVAEDDEFLQKILKIKIEKEGFEVEIAGDGDAVLTTAKSNPPDIILLDMVMPKKTGFEVLAELKKDENLKNIPVVALSNLGQESDFKKCMDLGAVDYLIKSNIEINDLVKKINQWIKK